MKTRSIDIALFENAKALVRTTLPGAEKLSEAELEEATVKALVFSDPAVMGHVLSRGEFTVPKHIALISKKIREAIQKKDGRLMICAPPGHSKSFTCSYWTPVWFLTLFPERLVIVAGHSADFAQSEWGLRVRDAIRDNSKVLGIYLRDDKLATGNWMTTKGGGMVSLGTDGPIMGRRPDLLVIEDPIRDAEDAYSQHMRDKLWRWWVNAIARLEPGASVILVMHRWHEDDLAGRLIKQGGWEVINLPAEAEAGDPLGRKLGESLWPERFPTPILARIKKELITKEGSLVWASRYQQRPTSEAGNLIRREWIKRYKKQDLGWKQTPAGPRLDLDRVIQSWDTSAFSDSESADPTGVHIWGRKGPNFYLLDRRNERFTFWGAIAEAKTLSKQWPEAQAKLVEAAAGGYALMETLRREISGIIAVKHGGHGKEARVRDVMVGADDSRFFAVTALFEGGNVFVPEDEESPWVREVIEQWVGFPNVEHDEDVDCMSQALAYLQRGAFKKAGGESEGAYQTPMERQKTHIQSALNALMQPKEAEGRPERYDWLEGR